MDQKALNFIVGFFIIFLILDGLLFWYYFKVYDPIGIGQTIESSDDQLSAIGVDSEEFMRLDKIEAGGDYVRVNEFDLGDEVSSPLVFTGEAWSNWFFEGSFMVVLEDTQRNELGYGIMQGVTRFEPGFQPYSTWLTFDKGNATEGVLVFTKDNPSGIPELDAEQRFPVTFTDQETRVVSVFFGASELSDHYQDCSMVYPLTRPIAKVPGLARAALETMLLGPTMGERNKGYMSSVGSNVKINRLIIVDGLAEVDFSKELDEDVGGSCRIGGITSQIEETLKQFPTVDEVIISVEGNTTEVLQP
jgi:hypothetical protein